jgi:hypothetical protein
VIPAGPGIAFALALLAAVAVQLLTRSIARVLADLWSVVRARAVA